MTERVGLLGWPVGHSISPAMHNAAFAELGLNWTYDLLPTHPDDLHAEITRLVASGYRGFNVTIPHKQAVLSHPLVSHISDRVRAIGAANTLIVQPDGTLSADNTDAAGFLRNLIPCLEAPLEGALCLVLGTGGSSKAVISALKILHPAAILSVSRHPNGQPDIIPYDQLRDYAPQARLIVNCTPVGMSPQVDQTPWDLAFPPNALLYDLIYNPPVTRLMQQAQSAGARVVGGLGMLVEQARLAFAMWTGLDPNPAVMRNAAQVALRGR